MLRFPNESGMKWGFEKFSDNIRDCMCEQLFAEYKEQKR